MRISSVQTPAVRHVGWPVALILVIFLVSGCSRSSPTPTPVIPTATPPPTPTVTPAQPSPSANTITPGLAEMLDLPVDRGLLLVQLAPNSPLADAGAHDAQQKAFIGNQIVYVGGDILTAVDSQSVSSWEDLQTLLEDNYQVGDKVTITLRQEDATLDVEVTLEEEGA